MRAFVGLSDVQIQKGLVGPKWASQQFQRLMLLPELHHSLFVA